MTTETAVAATDSEFSPEIQPTPSTNRLSERWRDWATNVAVFLGVLALWWAVTASGLVPPLFLPSPQAVVGAFIEANGCHPIQEGSTRIVCGAQGYFLWEHLLASLQRIGLGVLGGIAVGVVVGFAMALVPLLGRLFEPYLNFLRSLPPLGYIGLLIVWFGIGDTSKIWLLFLAAFPPIAMATIDAVRAIPTDCLLAAQPLAANSAGALRHVVCERQDTVEPPPGPAGPAYAQPGPPAYPPPYGPPGSEHE